MTASRPHIAIVYPGARLPVRRYGGAERAIDWLAQGLHALGHRVTLVVDSQSTHPTAEVAARTPVDADVIHYFSKVFQDPAYNPLGKPWLFTVEGNGQPAEVFPVNTVFISRDHARRHGSSVFVYNGVNPDGYTMARSRRPYACFLAKARWPVKNVDGAISVAKRAQMPLKIMGGYRFSFSRWVRWLGMADQAQKTAVLGEARALLFPVRWHEPFGIAVVEGLLSGAPVFGTPYGSLPELVTEDVGSLASSTDELARMLAARVVNPRICRDYAASRFSHVVMAEGYTKLYDRILAGQDLHVVAPQTISERPPEELLPWT